jgi:hypothetical protein
MDEQLKEDWLDARLREEAPYIDDAGFTVQVIQKLPAPRSRQSLRSAILLSITILASIITYLVSDGGEFLIRAAAHLASMPVLFLCLVAVACAIVMTAIGAGAAFSSARDER